MMILQSRMNNIINKYEKQNYLAGFFGKTYGEFLYSGTLSLETALLACGVEKGDEVLIPNNVCYRVLLSIVRLGAKAVIVSPENGYTITESEVAMVLKKFKIKIIVAVHNLGLPVDVTSIRKACGSDVKIIEDVSQAWGIKSRGKKIGEDSDFVITSFGISKPLSYGIGGGIFSDNENFRLLLDEYNKSSRINSHVLLPYVLPYIEQLDLKSLTNEANKIVSNQRRVAETLMNLKKDPKLNVWKGYKGDNPTWHKFPIWTEDEKYFKTIIKLLDTYNIQYELPHKITLDKTPMAINSKSIHVDFSGKKYYHILIKTRQSLLINIQKWIRSVN